MKFFEHAFIMALLLTFSLGCNNRDQIVRISFDPEIQLMNYTLKISPGITKLDGPNSNLTIKIIALQSEENNDNFHYMASFARPETQQRTNLAFGTITAPNSKAVKIAMLISVIQHGKSIHNEWHEYHLKQFRQ